MADLKIISGNLFALAAAVYQDTNQWIRMLSANGLTNPFISSHTPISLTLPAPDPNASGLPSAGISTPMFLGDNSYGASNNLYDTAVYDESDYA